MSYIEENEELYRAWIGTKKQDKYFEKIKNGGFSFVGLILPHLLLITRKMYIETIVLVIIEIILDVFTGLLGIKGETAIIINFAVGLTVAFSYYSLYEWNIRRKIEKYRKQGISDEEQIKIAQKCGGDKITLKVIIAIVVFVIMGMVVVTAEELMQSSLSSKSQNNVNSTRIINNTVEEKEIISNKDLLNETTSTWFIKDYTLKYNPEYWEDTIENGYQALKYKNNDDLYLYFLNYEEIENGLNLCETEEFRNYFENIVKNFIKNNLTQSIIQNVEWNKINKDFYIFETEAVVLNDNQTREYLNMYYIISDESIYAFLTDSTENISKYKNKIEKVLYTIEK